MSDTFKVETEMTVEEIAEKADVRPESLAAYVAKGIGERDTMDDLEKALGSEPLN